MSKQWINHSVDVSGEWLNGQIDTFDSEQVVDLKGANIHLYETSKSGIVLLSPVGGALVSYGDSEVYLRITYTNGNWEYRSAPLATPVEVPLRSL